VGDVAVVWDAYTGNRAYELATGDDFIQTLAYSSDGTKLASGGSEVIIWDMAQP
jgi:WD40 repeat protein